MNFHCLFQAVWLWSTFAIAQIPMLNKKVCWNFIWQERAKLKRWTNVEQRGGEMEKNKSPRKLGESEETGKTKLFQQDWKRGSLNEVLISFWKSWLIGWGENQLSWCWKASFGLAQLLYHSMIKDCPSLKLDSGWVKVTQETQRSRVQTRQKAFVFLANTKDTLLTFQQCFQMTFCQ